MNAIRAVTAALVLVGFAAVMAGSTYAARSDEDSNGNRQIRMLDDCDGSDAAWNEVGGCTRRGNVTVAEFDEELDSPRAAAVVGHQAWRTDPTYVVIKEGATLRIKNGGGRPHTFTEVAEFGGGLIPPLNEGLVPSSECPASTEVLPGGSETVSGLTVGNHRFLCCFHPWMRTLVKVQG
jgi:hypothetical protein